MVKFENDCVSCGLPCLGSTCPNRNVPHFYCDDCKSEVYEGDLFEFGGEELCIDCIKDRLPKVKAHDY